MKAREALTAAALSLGAVSDTPRLDAELLMAHAMGLDRNTLLLSHLDTPSPTAFDPLVARRLAREPVAYIIGTIDFWTITLRVAPGVLIPRPDSETLIEAAMTHFRGRSPSRILDLGTGSGALLLAALTEWPEATGIGVDASEVAISIARANAATLGLAPRATIQKGDWADRLTEVFDLILCNPPYVETSAALAPEVLNEPHEALFAGEDGLDDYRRLAPQIGPLLSPSGCAVIEIGATQAGPASALFKAAGFAVSLRKDLGRRDRCLVLTLT